MTTTAPQDGASRSRIDPRFRQRRIAIRRDEGRRRLKLLIAGASIVAALSAGIALVTFRARSSCDTLGSCGSGVTFVALRTDWSNGSRDSLRPRVTG